MVGKKLSVKKTFIYIFLPEKWNKKVIAAKKETFYFNNNNNNNNNSQQKKGTCQIVEFTVPADLRVKLKESEKKDKYMDLAWELKNL